MKEKLEEIYAGLQERLKSPFILTFIFVWTFHNWKLAFILFNFDDDTSLVAKLAYIQSYTLSRPWSVLLWLPLLWTFLSMIIYFVAVFVSEAINLMYTKWGRTFLYFWIDKNKLKTEDDFKELDKKREALQHLVNDLARKEGEAILKLREFELKNKNDSEKHIEEKHLLSTKIEYYEKQIDEINIAQIEAVGKSEDLKYELDALKTVAENLKRNLEYKTDQLDNFWHNNFAKLFQGIWEMQIQIAENVIEKYPFNLVQTNHEFEFLTEDSYRYEIKNVSFPTFSELTFTRRNKTTDGRPKFEKLEIVDFNLLIGMSDKKNIRYVKISQT